MDRLLMNILRYNLRLLRSKYRRCPPQDREIWLKQIQRIEGNLERVKARAKGSLAGTS
jgi:hypothetical protein